MLGGVDAGGILGVVRPRVLWVAGLGFPSDAEDKAVHLPVEGGEVCRARWAMLPISLCCLARAFSSAGSFFSRKRAPHPV